PWPRLFQNLRASRQTELCDRFPAHVVSEWLGNSEAVARAHYLKGTDRHWEAATEGGGRAHKRAHSGANRAGTDGKPEPEKPGSEAATPLCTSGYPPVHTQTMTPRGFEPRFPG